MKIKDGFVLREVAGQTLVIATGAASKEFHGIITLNETGTMIFRGIADGQSAEQIAHGLTQVFSVDSAQALRDVQALIAQMDKAGILCP